ncbi:MAG: hypothetical protein JXA42_09055 [Anaerolineales bacterium]|nr:hypothetical protein [Anaerolineales bacterium]
MSRKIEYEFKILSFLSRDISSYEFERWIFSCPEIEQVVGELLEKIRIDK